MHITELRLSTFRCIHTATLALQPGFNAFYGKNASGKTSLLEAVFFLGRGRSFRTKHPNLLIQTEQTSFTLFSKITHQTPQQTHHKLGLQQNNKNLTAHLNGKTSHTRAELARTLPLQFIGPQAHRLLEDGPAIRRAFLDWGMFHVEHTFHAIWSRYKRALRQRNAALRGYKNKNLIKSLDAELLNAGEALHKLRVKYIDQLKLCTNELLPKILTDIEISLDYRPGWSADKTLATALDDNLSRDMAAGFTQSGPHRAELVIKLNGVRVQDIASRGQQKLISIILLLSQAKLFNQILGEGCVLLVDDLPAELDDKHFEAVLSVLHQLDTQVLLTGIAFPASLSRYSPTMFHVEHGQITVAE